MKIIFKYKFDKYFISNKNIDFMLIKGCYRKYKKNKVIPYHDKINDDGNVFNPNELYCSGCKKYFHDLSQFIICGGCDKYFHCKIAGECIGKNCMNPGFDGEIHRTQYCYCCIQLYYGGKKCLCKKCQL